MNKTKRTGESLKDMFKNNVKEAKRPDVKTPKRLNAKTLKSKNVKPPKRKDSQTSNPGNAKTSKRQNVKDVKKKRHTIYLPEDISKKLQYAKIEKDSTLSEIIEEVLRRELQQ
jgi:hypothetical protein